MIGVALDEDLDKIREGAAGLTYPVLIDREHVLAQLYAISNVPMVVWIDERGRVVRTNATMFSTNTFQEFTGVDADEDLARVRAWVVDGVVDRPVADPSNHVADLSAAEQEAHLEYRCALHLHRLGEPERAGVHFDRAGELAPWDFTIRRAQMPLRGRDPFGEDFFGLFQAWTDAGKPAHGLTDR